MATVILEKHQLTLGFIPLNDCAPLVIAKEKGFFDKHGLDVELSREASWANIRDKVVIGQLDAAQMLAPMPIASTLGLNCVQKPMIVPMTLTLNGNAITVSEALYNALRESDATALRQQPVTASALKTLIDNERAGGKRKRTFATVFPYSMHNYQLRYWMAQAGIDPDEDVQMVVIPPPQMVDNLRLGHIDGFCVGEPWNSYAVQQGHGRVLITGYEIWNNSPEKVLGLTEAWATDHPATLSALIAALYEACVWIDKPGNRAEVSRIISMPGYVDVPLETVDSSMSGGFRYGKDDNVRTAPDFSVFHRYAANFPWRSHAVWILQQMIRWGQAGTDIDTGAVSKTVYRPDIFRHAVTEFAPALPVSDYKPEGQHAGEWILDDSGLVLGPDLVFDGRTFGEDQW